VTAPSEHHQVGMLRRLHQGLERVADDDLDAGSQVVGTRYLDGQAPQ